MLVTSQPARAKTVTVTEKTPAAAGRRVRIDRADTRTSALGDSTSIPVTAAQPGQLRPPGRHVQGRADRRQRPPQRRGPGRLLRVQRRPPASTTSPPTSRLTNDADDPVGAYLVSPDGNALGYGQNSINGSPGLSLTAYAVNPIAGTWTLIVDFAEPIVGNEVSQAVHRQHRAQRRERQRDGTAGQRWYELPAGVPVTVPVTITNNGAQAEDFFVDPRLNTTDNACPGSVLPGLRARPAADRRLAAVVHADRGVGRLGVRDRVPADRVRLRSESRRSGPCEFGRNIAIRLVYAVGRCAGQRLLVCHAERDRPLSLRGSGRDGKHGDERDGAGVRHRQ